MKKVAIKSSSVQIYLVKGKTQIFLNTGVMLAEYLEVKNVFQLTGYSAFTAQFKKSKK